MNIIYKNHMLSVKDCSLALDINKAEDAKGTIVILHGGPGGQASHFTSAKVLQSIGKTYNTVFFDQRGCGRSVYDLSLGISKEDMIEDIHSVIQYVKAILSKPIYIMGISYGGSLALMYLEHHSEFVKKAIICCPALVTLNYPPNLYAWNEAIKSLAFLLPLHLKELIDKHDGTKESLINSLNSELLAEFLKNNLTPMTGLEVLWHLYAIRKWYLVDFDLRPILKKLLIPILLLQGLEDESCPELLLSSAVKEANNYNIDYHILTPCGHNVIMDKAEEIEDLIADFCMLDSL